MSENFNYLNLFDTNKITKIYIASAYCDIKTLKDIKKHIKDKCSQQCDFKIFIDRYANHAFPGQELANEYKKLDIILKKGISKKSGIFLVKDGTLFHSKILYLQAGGAAKVYLGSMNYTRKGTLPGGNEEVLIEINGNKIVNDILSYFKNLEKKSENINQIRQKELTRGYSSEYDFFLSGSLFFEYANSNMFIFKLDIPNSIKEKVSTIDARLKDVTQDSINIIDFIPNIKINSERIIWKPYTIETSYGYFAPKEFINTIDKKINGKNKNRKGLIDEIIESIKNKEKLHKKMTNFLKKVNRKCNVLLEKQGNDIWKYEILSTRWERWFEKLLEKLDSDKDELSIFFERYINNSVRSPFPNIWDNEYITKNFIDSFEVSIISQLEKAKLNNRTNNKFIQFLLKYYSDNKVCSFGDIKKIIISSSFRTNLKKFVESNIAK